MLETTFMKVITIEAGTTIFIMVRAGDHFTLGTTHGITVACMTHGIMDMVVCTEVGADGTVLGFIAVGIHLGTMDMVVGTILGTMDMVVGTILGTMVDITDTVEVMDKVSMMDIIVA